MLNGKEAVIFDLDGTLIDSMWVWSEVDVKYLQKFGIEVPEDLHEAIEGMSFVEGAQLFKERFGIPNTIEEIIEEWNQMAFQMYVEEVPMKPGAIDFIKKIREMGMKTAIGTSNSTRLVEAVLKVHGLQDDFDAIVTADEVPKGKPDPQIYLEAASRIGVEPSKCIVFEDICNGILAGKRAGMEVCAVRDDFSEYQWDKKVEMADYWIEDYGKLATILVKNIGAKGIPQKQ